MLEKVLFPIKAFLLTRLLRGATRVLVELLGNKNISTHTPLARRDVNVIYEIAKRLISTHTPLARRDESNIQRLGGVRHFYSHASCEARLIVLLETLRTIDFYSHASCEARQEQRQLAISYLEFLLTRLLRGATNRTRCGMRTNYVFLLTRLLRGATSCTSGRWSLRAFLLTRLLRGAT